MDPSFVDIYVPQNLQLGDEIVGEEPLRIYEDADELVAVSLFPASDAISIAPTVVKPGQVFRLILKDRDSLLKQYSIQCLGVYSGNLQEVSLRLILDNDEGNTTLRFVKDSYDLKLSTPLLEKEIALIKMTDVAPSWARFTLTGGLSQHFSAYAEGGVVVVTSLPCLPKECVIDIPKQFSILLTYMGAEQRTTVLNFNVENTHRLRFEYSYDAEIEEGAANFKRIVKLKASGGKATYSLDDPSGIFSTHPKTGMLMVQHSEFVFIDTIGEIITLNVTATDGDQKARTIVNIRVRPKSEIKGFSFEKEEYKLTILPGQHIADGLLSLNGNISANVTYRLAEGPQDLFEISGGMLFYIGKYPKEDKRYLLLVLAETKKSPVAAVTKVDVLVKGIGSSVIELKSPGSVSVVFSSDDPPGPLLHVMEVIDEDETAKIEFSVAKVSARDFDGNVVDVPGEAIEIMPDGKMAQIKLKSEIGDNEWLSLEVVVEAKDVAHSLERSVLCHIEVMVTRIEKIIKAELPLRIIEVPSSIVIPSNLPEGSFIYEIRTSPMANVSFSVGNLSENFNVDELTGVISTNRPLRPAPSKEVLLVTAKTSGQKTSKNITIDITDSMEKIPKLLQKTIMAEIPVTAEIGYIVANITVTNIPVTFSSLEGSDLFLIDSKGIIITAGNLTKDVKNYILLARVKGEGGFVDATVNVTVDLDAGRSLKFREESYHFKVMQNILVNSYVGEVPLISKGMLPVKYSINAEQGEEQLLDIDEEGRITTREEFDTVGDKSRRFEVVASDGMRKAQTAIEVSIIPAFDCVPEFVKGENDIFYINENTPEDALIGRISAKLLDAKCELSFFFWDGERPIQENSFVRVDLQTGEIRSKRSFDFEDNPSYALVLGLRAGQRQTAEHGAVLIVRDTDDHPIKFQQKFISIEVSEATPLGSLITTARAVDPDSSQKVFYFMRQEGREFELNRETGEVKLAKILDRETDDRYEFSIGAANSPDFSEEDISEWMSVKLIVKDVNDNGPIFDHGHYEFLLEKMALPGRKVGKVHAVDPDLISENGESTTVFYSLADTQFEYRGTSRPMRGFFFVDQKTGEILLLEPINEFVGGVFHLQVQAADGLTGTAKKSVTSLRVIIHEESDVILSEIAKNPEIVELEDVQNVTQAIFNATGLRVLIKEIGYHIDEDVVLNKITDLKMVLINRTTFEIVPAEKTMAMIKNTKRKGSSMPKVARSQVSLFVQEDSTFHSPLFLIAFIFVLLLILASVILAVILCHYRTRYQREKQNFEDHRIIRNSLEEPGMCRRMTPPSPPATPTPEEDEQMGYMSQERRMSVGPEEKEARTKA